jgi:type II secretory pathway pseudopilin PulG
MTKQLPVTKTRGFTLVETIIYVGLFGIMFTGIFMSIYPFFTGAERLSRNIATEGETAFILAKIQYALASGIVASSSSVTSPAETGATTSDTLIIKDASNVQIFKFEQGTTTLFCPPPSITCGRLDFATSSATTTLNAERVTIENFTVTHHKPDLATGAPRYLEVSFNANGVPVGPVTYYLHF